MLKWLTNRRWMYVKSLIHVSVQRTQVQFVHSRKSIMFAEMIKVSLIFCWNSAQECAVQLRFFVSSTLNCTAPTTRI